MDEKPQTTINFNAPIYNNGGTITGDVYNNGKPAPQPKALSEALDTEEAHSLLDIARQKGWVDDNLQPRVSQPKAAILASVIADELGLSPRWTAFEELWAIDDLATKLTKAQDCHYYSSFLKEVEEAMP